MDDGPFVYVLIKRKAVMKTGFNGGGGDGGGGGGDSVGVAADPVVRV